MHGEIQRRISRVLTSWPFVLCLGILLLNDWWIKAAYPGPISGKLSDFSGVAVVGMLVMAIRPRQTLLIAIAIASAFLWWKGPWSQSVIDYINSISPFRIGRVVDFTDLMSLAVLPGCSHIVKCVDKYGFWNDSFRRFLTIPVFSITAFAVMGTSVARKPDVYSVRSSSVDIPLDKEKVAEAIAEVMHQHGLKCIDCTNITGSATYSGRQMTVSYSFEGTRSVSFIIVAYKKSFITGSRPSPEKKAMLRDALKSMFTYRFTGLEYVEQLSPYRHLMIYTNPVLQQPPDHQENP